MAKLKNIRLYNADKVPDHLFQEVVDFTEELNLAFKTLLTNSDVGNHIILSALTRFHAAVLVAMVTDEGIISAARTEAIGLIKNIEHLSGQTVLGNPDEK